MKLPRIEAVDVVENGVVVHFTDGSCAFYHQSVLQQHLASGSVAAPARRVKRKTVARVAVDGEWQSIA